MMCPARFLPVLTLAKFDPSFNVHWLNLILPSFVAKFDPSFNVH